MKPLCVLGAGSWGTALAMALGPRFDEIRLWARDGSQAERISLERQNSRYLSGFFLPDCVRVSHDLRACLSGAGFVLSVVPSKYLRAVMGNASAFISAQTAVVSATKGIEEGTLARMSELISTTLTDASRVAVLSGPSFAREIAAGEPAAIVIAAQRLGLAEEIQQAFATPALRFYTSSDVVGVEIGAALKNVIALAAGVCSGLGLGSNSVAALVTRGLAEITRLACALGGKRQTLSGLAGLGDLVLTATGDLSRNRSVGGVQYWGKDGSLPKFSTRRRW